MLKIDAIKQYFKTRPEVAAVYLFGSFAAERPRPFSDVDIGILFIEPCESGLFYRYIIEYIKDLSRILRNDVHPVVMNGAGELLAKQILSKGRCIYTGDATTLKLYRMRMYAMIADFSYYQAAIKKGFIKGLTEERQ